MKKLSKSQIFLIFISAIYIVVFFYLLSKKIVPTEDISSILLSVSGGLLVWLITYSWAKWIDRKDTITIDDFHPHRDTTEKILTIVKEDKNLILIEKKRYILKSDFYDRLYKDVKVAKISGISATGLIKSITERNDDSIYQSLLNNEGVDIKILISHPDSEFIEQRNKIESIKKGEIDPCINNIIDGIKSLIKFAKKHKDYKLTNRNRLTIHLSKVAFSQAITYVEALSSNNSNNVTLLMGMILYHDFGNSLPVYEIPVENHSVDSIYKSSIDCFDKIFNDTDEYLLFRWNEYGAKTDPLDNLKNSGFFDKYSLKLI